MPESLIQGADPGDPDSDAALEPTDGEEDVLEVAEEIRVAAENAVSVASVAILKTYAVALIAVGVAVIYFYSSAWWAGLILALYGVYLVLPGKKWVIY